MKLAKPPGTYGSPPRVTFPAEPRGSFPWGFLPAQTAGIRAKIKTQSEFRVEIVAWVSIGRVQGCLSPFINLPVAKMLCKGRERWF